jgi:hypothetical protein
MDEISFTRLQRAGVFSELANLFPSEPEVREVLADLGADRARDLPRLPTVGTMPFGLYWRKVCEQIDNGMFAAFGLNELIAEARRRFPGNTALRNLAPLGQPDGGDPQAIRPDTTDLRVLCLQAGPDTLNQLKLRQEHAIILQIARQRGRRGLAVTSNPATRRNDIVAEILASRPDIVHFAGHGTQGGRLVFEEEDGTPSAVTVEALASVLAVLPSAVSCLILGSCFGGNYSHQLLGPVQAVAGSITALPDPAALEFTRGFYTALAIGGSAVAKAYDAGLAQMHIQGFSTRDMRFESVRAGGQ